MQETTPEQFQAAINALRLQRDAANDQVVQIAVQLAQVSAELTKAQEQIKALEAK